MPASAGSTAFQTFFAVVPPSHLPLVWPASDLLPADGDQVLSVRRMQHWLAHAPFLVLLLLLRLPVAGLCAYDWQPVGPNDWQKSKHFCSVAP